MSRSIRMLGVLLAGLASLAACSAKGADSLHLEQIKLPPGFKITVYAAGVPNAREMALGSKGTLFVGSRTAGNVYAVMPGEGDFGGRVVKIAGGLNMPSGVAFHDGSLYVAEVSRITRYDNIENQLPNVPKPVVVNDKLPL